MYTTYMHIFSVHNHGIVLGADTEINNLFNEITFKIREFCVRSSVKLRGRRTYAVGLPSRENGSLHQHSHSLLMKEVSLGANYNRI